MILFKFIFRTCRSMLFITLGMAVLSGACNAGLIAVVNHSINTPGRTAALLVGGFVALGLGKVITGFLSQVMLASYAQEQVARLRQNLVEKILSVPLRRLEEIGASRLMVALTDDVMNITQALLGFPIIAVNVAILLGGTVYLGYLSIKVLFAVFVFCVLGAIGYRFMMDSGFKYLGAAREEEDRLFTHFRGLTEGIKELKLHRSRRGVFLKENVETTTNAYKKHNVRGETQFVIAQSWSHLLFYGLIGLLLFFLPTLETVKESTLTAYVITTLYLMGPLAGVLSSFSMFGRASVSLQKVEQLGITLDVTSAEPCALGGDERPVSFQRLELVDVTHSYHREREDSKFTLGPISMTFRPGEIVFLAGGNGSGKSTLAKIITGLYPPEAGEIRLDGKPVTDKNRDDYRQLFSAVFTDFFLFDNLLGLQHPELDSKARFFLEELHLNHKVKIKDGVFSTTALSQGQRKRLALLTAYLEDRPFYLFDEWASDQDPIFKEIFYTKLLPDLKARGKAVLAITHDDKYFHLADRFYKLDYGKLVDVPPPTPLPDPIISPKAASKLLSVV